MELSERKMKILKAIVDDYIATGIPVGSRTLSKKPEIAYSPATIRNEMADLEDMGYLDKPHTSAGRTPSDLAYRYYVDRLMQISKITPKEASQIKQYYGEKINEMEKIIENTANVLSETTHHIALVMRPQLDVIKLKRVQLVKITDTKALVVLITDSGIIKDTIITISRDTTEDNVNMLSNMLTDKLKDMSISKAAKLLEQHIAESKKEHMDLMNEVFDVMSKNAEKRDVVLGGVTNILNYPEYSDMEKAKDFFNLIHTKEKLFKMLDTTADLEFSIRIGKENSYDEFRNMSVVTATYSVGGEKVGSYGIIGPTRMDYSKVISVLHYVGASLNDILSCFLDDDNKK